MQFNRIKEKDTYRHHLQENKQENKVSVKPEIVEWNSSHSWRIMQTFL